MLRALRAVLGPAFAILLLSSPASAADCPAAGEVASSLEETFRKKVQVKRIRPAAVAGLCEVVVSLQGRTSILYTDGGGRYFITGQVVDAETRRDLAREALAEYNKFTPEEIQQLESLTALTYGESGPSVYFVTDPDWPYCKRAGQVLMPMADAGEIRVRVLMFPLDIHKQAKAKCVAVICDGKGFKDLDGGYTSDNQCAEGIAKVDKTIAFLRGKGVGSTPTYIFPDGLFRSGVMQADQLRSRLGLAKGGEK